MAYRNRSSGALGTLSDFRKLGAPGLLESDTEFRQNKIGVRVELPGNFFEEKREGIQEIFKHRKAVRHHGRKFYIAGDIKTRTAFRRDRFKFIEIKIPKTVRKFRGFDFEFEGNIKGHIPGSVSRPVHGL